MECPVPPNITNGVKIATPFTLDDVTYDCESHLDRGTMDQTNCTGPSGEQDTGINCLGSCLEFF